MGWLTWTEEVFWFYLRLLVARKMNWKHRQYSIFILPSAGTCGRKKRRTPNLQFTLISSTIKCPGEVRKQSLLPLSDLLLLVHLWFVSQLQLFSLDLWPRYFVFQEHPYVFTKMNSLSPSTTTVAPTTHSTAQHSTALPLTPLCPDSVPVWLAAVLSVGGLAVGWAGTCFFLLPQSKPQ